jgi:hypothetical protein
MEAQSGENVVPENEVSSRINLGGEFPQMDFCCEHWKDVSSRFGLHVAAPEIELDDFRVVK